jgi:pyruvate dehydrogenase E2 component (dihydrolipoamide acetyltransferase)
MRRDAVSASPSTRVLALRLGVDLAALGARLGRGALAREDVEAAAAGAGAPAGAAAGHWDVDHAAYGPVRIEPLSRVDRTAAAALAAAQAAIPAVTHFDRADLTEVEAFRASLAGEARARGLRLTALAFHVRALARCLRAFPRFNASLTPDGARLVLKDYVHVGIAVDTPHGLVVPVIRDADRLGLWAVAAALAELADRAQRRRLGPETMGGASMTISNLGGVGGTAFTPIVNPPEAAILGLGRAETAPVWDGAAFAPRLLQPLCLSYDHRVVNGADAARFLARHARLLADPRLMAI